MPLDKILNRDSCRDFFFIQIGACDGVFQDPIVDLIKELSWRGIFVEPVKYLFDSLVSHYSGREGFIFENAAIADHEGTETFYFIDPCHFGELPDYVKGIGSLDKYSWMNYPRTDEQKKWYLESIDPYMIKTLVPCMTLGGLCRKHRVNSLDLLQIDAEGYDSEIIQQVDFEHLMPSIISYENKHVTDKAGTERFLRAKGYELKIQGGETIAVRSDSKHLVLDSKDFE